MTDTPNVEPAGAGGVANPPASSGAVEGNAELLSKLVKDAIAAELKPIKGDISGLYSRQDKDRNQLSELLDEFKKQKASGLADSEAEVAAQNVLAERDKQSKRDQLIDALAEKFLSPSTQTPGTGASGAVDAAKVVSEYGLDPKDPMLAVLMSGNYPNQDALELAIGRHIKAQRSAPSPTAAQSPADPGGKPAPKDASALKADYIKDMTAARGNKSLGKAIIEKYRGLGLDTGSVDFRV